MLEESSLLICLIIQAIRAPRSQAARATRWTNRLVSGNVASRACDACYLAGTRHDHQMRPPQLWSMSPVTIPSVCRFLSRSRVPSVLNSKVNHNNNMNNNCACTVVSHSRGFACFDLTFCPLSTAVQWSTRADFNNVVGERELLDWISYHGTMGAQCLIAGLTQGRRYFLRAACGNVKGWGSYRNSVPASVVPSSE